ncbi:hypothetical protein IEN85_01420 [Pelagicoccus sp. NFK12]|uniref:Uncharacterized protein n=1 Tax=Pelagicoccus enzymogenes TaxID=2773457 RepID=A0A927IFU3_9BACT|nr:hypothetical protein [Pelagicoccus enzymogenes]MBD5778154.1 hypothetical protein [Pelagicoccus enzymogenes]
MKTLLAVAVALAATCLAQAQQERIIVYPVEAIADGARFSKQKFNETYPGIDVTQYGLSDEGWYIRYKHELLTYLYGPLEDLNYARRQKKLLEEIRLSVVLKNPSLSSSTVDIIRFDFNATPDNMGVAEDIDNPYLIPELTGEEGKK